MLLLKRIESSHVNLEMVQIKLLAKIKIEPWRQEFTCQIKLLNDVTSDKSIVPFETSPNFYQYANNR